MSKRLARVPILEILESVSKTEVRCCVAAIVSLALLGRGFPTDSKIRKRPSLPFCLSVCLSLFRISSLNRERDSLLWIVSAALFVPFFPLLPFIVILVVLLYCHWIYYFTMLVWYNNASHPSIGVSLVSVVLSPIMFSYHHRSPLFPSLSYLFVCYQLVANYC